MKNKTDAELRYIIKDAGEAAKAMKDHDPKAEAKYLDQVNDAVSELYRRKNKAMNKRKLESVVHSMISGDAGKAEKFLSEYLKKKSSGLV